MNNFIRISTLTGLMTIPVYIICMMVSSCVTPSINAGYISFDRALEHKRYFDQPVVEVVEDSITKEHVVEVRGEFVNYGGHKYLVDNGYYIDSRGRRFRPITVTTTAYVARPEECGEDYKVTATGTSSRTTYGLATDWRALPRGSILHIAGYGIFPVDDTGGAMRQNWRNNRVIQIDLRIPHRRWDGVWRSTSECVRIAKQHGVKRNRTVLLLIE